MEEAPDPIVIPGWIWFFVALVIIGAVVALIVHRDRNAGEGHRSRRHGSSRRHRSSSGRSSGKSSRSRRREGDPFDKY